MSEIQQLRDDVLELDRQIRRLRAQQQQRGAGDFGRANAIIGVLPSANVPAHGSVGLWTNQSGGALGIGAVVIQNGDRQFDTTATADDLDVVGALTAAVANTAEGRLRHQGYHPSVIVEGAVVAGQFLRTSTTAGAAEDAGTIQTAGTFGMALTAFAGPGAGTVAAYLFGAVIGGPSHDWDFFNGTFVETLDADVSEAAGVVTLSLQAEGGGDLTMRFSSGLTTLSTPKTITLTLGSDDSPQANYIYVLESDQTQLTKSTTQWPATEHIKVGYYLVPSAAFVAANGCYIQQQWNDHRMGTDNMGHMAHMAMRERLTAARYFDGIDPNGTTSYLTIVGATVDYKATAGVIFQMHEHASPAVDTSGGDVMLVVNWNGDAFHDITNLFDIVDDSGGNTIGNNKWFNLVIWGVANKNGTYEPTMINLPAGFYNTQASAEQDVSGFDNFDLPREYDLDSSTAFLIARLTVQKQAGTWAFGSVVDLRRGDLLGARGGASSSETEFPDNTFNVFDATDNTKIFGFQADQISPATTRTYTAPNADGILALTAQADGSIDASDVGYTPAVLADWDGDADPGDVDDALDELAERTTDLEEGGVFEMAYSSTSLWGTSGVWLDQTPFIGTVNGNPTSTSVVYNHTSGELSISHGQVLHNTTKGERVFIEAVNTGTNTLTVEANSPDDSDTWDNTDALTTASQTNTGRGGIFVDIDVTPHIIANSAVVGVSLILTGARRNADTHYVITHPYETFDGLRENIIMYIQDDLLQYEAWLQGIAVADGRYYFTMCFLLLAADNNTGTCRLQGQFTSLVS